MDVWLPPFGGSHPPPGSAAFAQTLVLVADMVLVPSAAKDLAASKHERVGSVLKDTTYEYPHLTEGRPPGILATAPIRWHRCHSRTEAHGNREVRSPNVLIGPQAPTF